MHNWKLFVLSAGLLGVCTLAGCSGKSPPAQSDNPAIVQTQQELGDVFLESNLKIKSTITDLNATPSRSITFELYVDSEGDGSGLLGFGETLCDVIVSNNNLYVVVDANNVVQVTDLTGRMVPTTLNLAGQGDLTAIGFTVRDGTPLSYDGKDGNLIINTVFGISTNTFDPQSVTASNSFTLTGTLDYIVEYNAAKKATAEQADEGKPEVVDFYNNSKYGVTIDGTVYSLGDTCNPSTYFRGATPEGLVTSTEYKEDTRVDFQHVSYLSPDGRTVFTVTDNYVQAIQSTANFEFLGIARGADFKALKKQLGFSLTKKDLETWEPIDEDIVPVSSKSKCHAIQLGDYYIEFRSTDNQTLSEIYVEQLLDFKGAVN